MKKEVIATGLALFAMFFGAGNLIFPPFLGMESGYLWPIGLAAFVLIDVILACLGIYALNAAGGGEVAFERTIGKVPALILNTAAILCTGVLIAMPRTAATTFEMAIEPNFQGSVALFPFSLIFFALVLALTIRESKLVDVIGKLLTPLLVLGVVVLIVVGIINPLGPVGAPHSEHVIQDGILSGYQAMDIICVIGYSIVLKDAFRSDGVNDSAKRLHLIALSSVIAAVLLTMIYSGLTFLGATTNATFGPALNQADLIVAITYQLMGQTGITILGVVVALACLTTAIGLIGATAAYFEHITHGRIPYQAGVVACVIAGVLICNLGLDLIISAATPLLSLVCPPFMTTLVLILFRNHIKTKLIYQGAALGAFLASVALTAQTTFSAFPAAEFLPLFSYGFAWLPFAIAGGVAGALIGHVRSSLPSR